MAQKTFPNNYNEKETINDEDLFLLADSQNWLRLKKIKWNKIVKTSWDQTIAWNKTFSWNTWIWTTNPTEKLEVSWNIKANQIKLLWDTTIVSKEAWIWEYTGFVFNKYDWTRAGEIKKDNLDNIYISNTQTNVVLSWQYVGIWTYTPTDKLEVNWTTTPSVDNSYTLWKSWKRWSSVWAANWTIQTSDKRTKTDITESKLWLDFINKLNPVSYKWIEWWNTVTYEEVEVEKEVQEEIEIKYQEESIKLINWKYIKVIEEKTRTEKVFDEVDLYDEKWNVIWKHQIPRMVTKLVKEKKEIITPTAWKRNHFWFIAQEVEEALAWTDFWWLVTDENWQYALRYDQFISPLVKAVKELKARVEYLENNK